MGLGYDEAMPLAFLAPDDLDRAGVAQPSIRLTNPLAAEESVLRPSLRPGLLKAIRYNQSHRQRDVALFEIGKVFGLPAGPGLPDEREVLAVVRSDADVTAAVEAWTVLRQSLGVDGVTLEQVPVDGLHPGRSARLRRRRRRPSARWGRSIRPCSTRWGSSVGWRGSRSTSTPSWTSPTGSRPTRR